MSLNFDALKRLSQAAIIAVALIVPFEGEKLKSYYDPPGVATICRGHTRGVTINETATPAQCDIWLGEDVAADEAAVNRLVKVKISDKTRAAFIDFVFNAGAGNFSRSTMLRKLNAGDIAGACDQFPRWVYDEKGNALPGLVRRRAAEKRLCLEGLKT